MLATSTRPTVLIVDDEPDVRDLARALLELDGFDVVGEAVNGAEGVQRYLELDPPPVPTVVLLDNRMPVRSGMEAARDILARYPTQLIVLFTAYASPELSSSRRERLVSPPSSPRREPDGSPRSCGTSSRPDVPRHQCWRPYGGAAIDPIRQTSPSSVTT